MTLKNCISNQSALRDYAYKPEFITSLEKPEGLITQTHTLSWNRSGTWVTAASFEQGHRTPVHHQCHLPLPFLYLCGVADARVPSPGRGCSLQPCPSESWLCHFQASAILNRRVHLSKPQFLYPNMGIITSTWSS